MYKRVNRTAKAPIAVPIRNISVGLNKIESIITVAQPPKLRTSRTLVLRSARLTDCLGGLGGFGAAVTSPVS
jgi:hypothetical protein